MEPLSFELFNNIYILPWYVDNLIIAALLGIVIGIEREISGKAASLRTFTLICLGSCLFTILSIEAAGGSNGAPYDMTRIAAQIVTGVGFLGGGVIFKTKDKIEGITTGAMIWFAAAIGVSCGFGQNELLMWAFTIATLAHLVIGLCYKIAYRNKLVP